MKLSRPRLIEALAKHPTSFEDPLLRPQAVVGLIFSEDCSFFLLTRRSDTLKSHAGQVALPGGMIDAGETEVQALMRECQEELGIQTSDEHWLTPYLQDTRSIANTRVRVYLGHLSGQRDSWLVAPYATEVADWSWCPTKDLFEHSKWQRLGQIPGTSVAYAGLGWTGWTHLTWGLTASILHAFVRRFGFDPLK